MTSDICQRVKILGCKCLSERIAWIESLISYWSKSDRYVDSSRIAWLRGEKNLKHALANPSGTEGTRHPKADGSSCFVTVMATRTCTPELSSSSLRHPLVRRHSLRSILLIPRSLTKEQCRSLLSTCQNPSYNVFPHFQPTTGIF